MDKIIVRGGSKLFGDVNISGMKNSALPILFACLLIEDECLISNVPNVDDVKNTLEILRGLGVEAEFCFNNCVRINAKNATNLIKNQEIVSKMRASCYLMGTLLSRFGKVEMGFPGGCNFGVRPIEQHIKGFEQLGARCIEDNEKIFIKAQKKLKSKKITLDKISVGATINMILVSVLLEGLTTVENCAIEPHVDDLITFLNKCGANIYRKDRTIFINGVKKLKGASYNIFPDSVEALTYMALLGICQGDINIVGIVPMHLDYVLKIFIKMGCNVKAYNNVINIRVTDKLNGANVITAPYPCFPTDLHPQFSALLCYTRNGGSIRDDVFPTRFAYVKELKKMDARIHLVDNTAYIKSSKLHGASLDSTDLRAGAALVLSALGAEGNSEINNVDYILRGYENLVGKISALGGNINFINN